MPLSLLFCHGWGFDAGVWDPLAALLPEFTQLRDDAGYFGASAAPVPSEPVLAVTHSFGTMRLLAAPPEGLAGMVAINGFDRFTAAPDFPGTPARVVDRMVSAVAQEPETVLADFHARIGSAVPMGEPDAERLQASLVTMRDGDLRAIVGQVRLPILSLQGAHDTLLPMALRETVFAAVPGVMRRTHPDAGHLLQREDPGWCADAIRSFAATLA
ncbi:alpha/beta fold hydrolase [Novosphingobium sp. 9U]|uniref:alpha/beta fold hydrolase n=1 Tax=Novosphingobium sp. 9U TaxID=2653158 RepID=UPI0012F27CE1|nr:alpha/beta hydrolase [Novosphingobium sp. 9U]VWX52814.1 Biotin synthesis protein bioH [Novosphingobium sp. 9U]